MNYMISDRPLLSFCIFAYNQEKYISDAIEGAFCQTYSPLEILLSDDCSTDKTFAIMKQMADEYKGPHKLVINKNEENIGLAEHINKIAKIACGEWLVFAAGDDISLPNRCNIVHECTKKRQDIKAINTGIYKIKEDDSEIGYSFSGSDKIYFNGASSAYHKTVFKFFEALTPKSFSEDIILSFRALLLGTVAFIDHPTIKYRILDSSQSNMSFNDHLGNIKRSIIQKSNILTAVEQRLVDLQKFKGSMSTDQYNTLIRIHQDSIIQINKSINTLNFIVAMWECNLFKRIWLFVKGGDQISFSRRIKIFLLSFYILRVPYLRLAMFIKKCLFNKRVYPSGKIELISIDDVPQHGTLIYL